MGSFRVSNGSTCWQSFLQRLRFVSAFLWRNDIVNSSQQLPFGIRPAQNSGIVQRCTSRTFVGKWLRFARPTMERLAIWPNPSEMRLALPEGVNRMGSVAEPWHQARGKTTGKTTNQTTNDFSSSQQKKDFQFQCLIGSI